MLLKRRKILHNKSLVKKVLQGACLIMKSEDIHEKAAPFKFREQMREVLVVFPTVTSFLYWHLDMVEGYMRKI